MSLEQRLYEDYRREGLKVCAAATTLTPLDVVVLGDTTAGAFTVTLPPAALCAGKIFTFRMIAVNGAMTIAAPDSINWTNLATLDAVGDYAVYFCDGYIWAQMASKIA